MAEQAVSNLFGYHNFDHLATPARISLFARLHILDVWHNTTCIFREAERCHAPLTTQEGAAICAAFGDFCFEIEDPLNDTDSTKLELERLFWKALCTAHRDEAKKEDVLGKVECYLPIVLGWRGETLKQSPKSPDTDKERHSKLGVLIPKTTNMKLTSRKRDSGNMTAKGWSGNKGAATASAGYHARMSMSSFEQDPQEFDKVSLHSMGIRNENRSRRRWSLFTNKANDQVRMEID
ncbi:hypothetical protein CB0940_08110 [Cercospora beticola]|uniref:Uncharacterized protein n=1 Tax=Cercospora beticola TaxID=122368 RepID=A0A2G5HQZ8_CERBT|nr:hypothetical protein CB0940_08110 [Cercospora beticola]PIA94976.1 hypothetical protein CB0940_08110 [Cercospora beticola]WPB04677.1 hypothetical protein RHO25_009323 [Cercospora beticola]